jgi:hypothetical protein
MQQKERKMVKVENERHQLSFNNYVSILYFYFLFFSSLFFCLTVSKLFFEVLGFKKNCVWRNLTVKKKKSVFCVLIKNHN